MRTVSEITQYLSEPPRSSRRGSYLHEDRRLSRDRHANGGARHRLVTALLAQEQPRAGIYRHPEDAVRIEVHTAVGQGGAIAKQRLDPADLEWLRRLPAPEHITYEQAVELARFALQVEPRTPDARLIAAVWQPVKDRHDRARAESELANAQAAWPSIPAEAREALQEALAGETSELTDAERADRARRILNDIEATRRDAQTARITDAQARLDDLDRQAQERTALDRKPDVATV